MTQDVAAVTESVTPDITDRFETETNVVPEAEPKEVEPTEDKTTEAETPATEPKVEPTEPKPINPRTAQRKAEKERLIREAAVATEKNAALEARIKELEKSNAPEPEQPKARDLSKEPNLQDYDDVVEYTLDMARYDRRQEAEQEKLEKQVQALSERAETLKVEKPDYDEKIGAVIQSQLVTPDIEKAILASPVGADIMYHLGNHGADLMTLRGLPSASLPQAIKAIEAFIKNGGEQQEQKKITKAAPPITPPGVSASTDRTLSSYSQEELEQMPMNEFKRLSKMK